MTIVLILCSAVAALSLITSIVATVRTRPSVRAAQQSLIEARRSSREVDDALARFHREMSQVWPTTQSEPGSERGESPVAPATSEGVVQISWVVKSHHPTDGSGVWKGSGSLELLRTTAGYGSISAADLVFVRKSAALLADAAPEESFVEQAIESDEALRFRPFEFGGVQRPAAAHAF